MTSNRKHLGAAAALMGLALLPAAGQAFTFSGENMTNWGSCDADCSTSGGLSYTDDQVEMFIDEMEDAGNTRAFWYENANVWAEDVTEDELTGTDRFYTDKYDVYIYSGHGSAPVSDGAQRFSAPYCKKGSTDSCRIDSRRIRLGEKSGSFANPHPGQLRWVILCTCFSVHTQPNEQWRDMLRFGTDIVFGYRGLSADSENTDEVPEDFAEEAFDDDDKMKGAWFWAVEDWWIDDVGALVASGTSEANAVDRRENLRRTWSPRSGNQQAHTWTAWSWHEG